MFLPWASYDALPPPQPKQKGKSDASDHTSLEEKPAPSSSDEENLLATVRQDIEQIGHNNEIIADPDVSAKLDRLCDLATTIVSRIKNITDRHSALYNQNASGTEIPTVLKTLELVERHFERGLYDFSQKDRFDLDVALESLNADLRANGID